MALHIGSNKVNINLNNVAYYLNLFSESLITNGVVMLTSDGYILKDSNGLYLTLKESE